MNYINFAELAGLVSEGFNKIEVVTTTSGLVKTTTIYGGKANVTDPATADSRTDWNIRRSVIVEEGGDLSTITNCWAVGSWTDRASLTYKYN